MQKGTLLGKPLQGHQGGVLSVAVSPDDKRIASGGEDNTVIIWDVESKQVVFKLVKHTAWVNCVCFSPDGKSLASGSDDGTALIWDTETGTVLTTLVVEDIGNSAVLRVAFTQYGLKLASATSNGIIRVFRTYTAELLLEFRAHENWVWGIVWSSDDQRLISASWDTTVKFWNSSTGRQITQLHPGHTDWIHSLAIASDGSFIATASRDKTVRLWSTETYQQIGQPLEHSNIVVCVTMSTNGALLASGTVDGKLYLWSIRNTLQWLDEQEGYKKELKVEQQPRTNEIDIQMLHHQLPDFHMKSPTLGPQERKVYPETQPSIILGTATDISSAPKMQHPQIAGPPYVFDPNTTYPDPNVQAWAQYYKQGGIDPAGVVYFISVPGLKDASSPPKQISPETQPSIIFGPATDISSAPKMQHPQIAGPPYVFDPNTTYPDPIVQAWAQYYNQGGINPAGVVYFISVPGLKDASSPKQISQLDQPSGGPYHAEAHQQPARRANPFLGPGHTMTSQTRDTHSAPQASVMQVESYSYSSVSTEVILQDLTASITKVGEFAVARGGFGEVWKCIYHTNRGPTDVAVKALLVYASDQLGEGMKKKTKRLQRELITCARLRHENILPLFGYTYGFGLLMAMVYPWAENGNLTTFLEREGSRLSVVRRFKILLDITAGLQYLHNNNVIHGDLTGPNVLIKGDGMACLADFGLSLVYSEVTTASKASWTSSFHGNLRWLAPELFGDPEDDLPVRPSKCSDIYSFGGVMLQVLSNNIPYYYLSDAAFISRIGSRVKPLRARYPAVSDKYWGFIRMCWSDAMEARPIIEEVVEWIVDESDLLSA